MLNGYDGICRGGGNNFNRRRRSKMYTINLDNDKGRGEVRLINDRIVIILPSGEAEPTGVHSTIATLDRDIQAMYGSDVWDLQKKNS